MANFGIELDSPLDRGPGYTQQPQAGGYNPQATMMQAPTLQDTYQGSATGDALNTAGSGAIATGNPYGMVAGLALKGIGKGMDIYGKYKAREEARERYEQELELYKIAQAQEAADRASDARRLDRQEGYFGADYARALGSELAGQYSGVRQGGN